MPKPSLRTGSHPHADRGRELYETPPSAVEALLGVENLPRRIWEPAAGRGAIVNVLREHGHEVIATRGHTGPATFNRISTQPNQKEIGQ